MQKFDVEVDLSDVPGLEHGLRSAATVYLPDNVEPPTIVLVEYPGSAFNRKYFDISAKPGYSEAAYHVEHGFVVVAVDHVRIGDSTPCDLFGLTLENMAAANHRTATAVLDRLREGSIADGVAPIQIEKVIGAGQSMGGCLLTVQQANHRTFDAIALLGWSAIHEDMPSPDGNRSTLAAWLPRDMDLRTLASMEANPASGVDEDQVARVRYGMHWHEDDTELVDMSLQNMSADPALVHLLPDWRTIVIPACCGRMMAPGVVEPEAAQIECPILIACGEVDCVADPHAEPALYPQSSDVRVVVVERMAHMHNFAETREKFWMHIEDFAHSVRAREMRH